MGHKLTIVQLVLIHLANRGCLTLEELEKYTGAGRGALLVTLTRLHQRGIIYRKWRHFGGRRYREYCLKYRDALIEKINRLEKTS